MLRDFKQLFFLLVFPAIVNAEGVEHWSKADYLLSSFYEIALNNEYSTKKSTVRKWTKAVRYYFVHRVADQALHEKLSKLHLQHLIDITGVDIKAVKQKSKANLLIVFSTEKRLENELLNEFKIKSKRQRNQLFRHSVCLAHFSINPDNSIRKAIVIIPVDRARAHAKLLACIVEELTQIMGLPNDSDKVFPSIFNDKSFNDLLTGLDYLLLKMLYHPMVKVGMTKAAVAPVIAKIIKKFKKEGIVASAEKTVMKGGLYPLLY
mgnify:CR=1 FL=1